MCYMSVVGATGVLHVFDMYVVSAMRMLYVLHACCIRHNIAECILRMLHRA